MITRFRDALVLVALAICSSGQTSAEPATRHVLMIGVDGLRSDVLELAKTPHMDALIAEGAFTNHARILPPHDVGADTSSGPGWTTLLTGVWPDKHGVMENSFAGANDDVPLILTSLLAAQPAAVTDAVVTWEPLASHILAHGGRAHSAADDDAATEHALKIIKRAPSLMFVHLDACDHAGHLHGFGPESAQYRAAIEATDARIGRLVEAANAGAEQDWLIIVVTDHGGRGTAHGGLYGDPLVMNVPMIIAAPGEQSSSLPDPTYAVDVAPTVIRFLMPDAPLESYDGLPSGLGIAHSAIEPASRGGWFADRFRSFNVHPDRETAQVVFIGDSITQGWEDAGKAVWNEHFAPLGALNLGIGGDRTQHVLWRIDHGNLDGLDPRVVVIMIGTNNSNGQDNSAEEIVEGVTRIVRSTQERLPEARILLLEIFPRGAQPNAQREKLDAVNAALRRLARVGRVEVMNLKSTFVEEDGTIDPEVMPDFLHLSEAGYLRWAKAVLPQIERHLSVIPTGLAPSR